MPVEDSGGGGHGHGSSKRYGHDGGCVIGLQMTTFFPMWFGIGGGVFIVTCKVCGYHGHLLPQPSGGGGGMTLVIFRVCDHHCHT